MVHALLRALRSDQSHCASPQQYGAGAKIGAIRTEKASASLARFGAECNTAQAPRSARSGRRRRRPRSRTSAPSAKRRRRKIGAIRTEKASASLARFGAECKTAQAPRSARSGRRRRRPRSRTSAPSARRRRRKIGAIRTEKASASVARFGAQCKTAQAQDRRDQDGEGVGLSRALRRRVQDGAGAKIGAIRTEKASASVAHFGAECKTAQAQDRRDQDGEGVGLSRALRRPV
ncbi:hypothetical protein PR003_g31119 [Phytophthora rubi]|uniref:Uncharacterized protein n=1 Tax=Phytophthora rubi TaxID=129364 RepID=A0A6A4BBD8_9STRA|nr:hypothetical protein PR003_g31119 [Phytophthora rubi]